MSNCKWENTGRLSADCAEVGDSNCDGGEVMVLKVMVVKVMMVRVMMVMIMIKWWR